MICFYHLDADGKCAGFWVNRLAKQDNTDRRIFYKINHGMKFPFDEIIQDEQVYIVDYSIEPDEMRKLLSITENVTWIDHHISAIVKYQEFEKPIRGIRYDGIAGCMLTYCYLKYMTDGGIGEEKNFDISMIGDAPYFTKLIADYDVWSFEYGDDTRNFHIAFESEETDPDSDFWDYFFDADSCDIQTNSLIENGKIINKYQMNFAKEYCESKGFYTEFEGYNVYAMNIGLAGSDWFDSIDGNTYDILMLFSYNGRYNNWSYSLYSTKVDCQKIAVKYGGGGHKGAAGFSSDELLLKSGISI